MRDEESSHIDTNIIEFEVNEDYKTIEHVIMEKDVEIKELKDKLSKANFIISFLEQENKKLKVNKLLLNKHKVDVGKEYVKGKVVVETDDLDEHQE